MSFRTVYMKSLWAGYTMLRMLLPSLSGALRQCRKLQRLIGRSAAADTDLFVTHIPLHIYVGWYVLRSVFKNHQSRKKTKIDMLNESIGL